MVAAVTWYGGKTAAAKAKAARSGARRRARVAEAPGFGHVPTLDEVYERASGYCCICRCFVPLSNGGRDDLSNAGLAHLRRNSRKGSKTGPKRKGLRRTMWRRKPKKREIPSDAF